MWVLKISQNIKIDRKTNILNNYKKEKETFEYSDLHIHCLILFQATNTSGTLHRNTVNLTCLKKLSFFSICLFLLINSIRVLTY